MSEELQSNTTTTTNNQMQNTDLNYVHRNVVGETSSAALSSNNNYVDFNQFIMQHNIVSGNNDNGTFGYHTTAANTNPFNYSIYDSPNSTFGINLTQATAMASPSATATAAAETIKNFSTDYYSKRFHNNNDPFSQYNTNSLSDHVSPLFDCSLSSLQATAPEFVPRFSVLTLNDNSDKPSSSSSSSFNLFNSKTLTVPVVTTANDLNEKPITKNGGGGDELPTLAPQQHSESQMNSSSSTSSNRFTGATSKYNRFNRDDIPATAAVAAPLPPAAAASNISNSQNQYSSSDSRISNGFNNFSGNSIGGGGGGGNGSTSNSNSSTSTSSRTSSERRNQNGRNSENNYRGNHQRNQRYENNHRSNKRRDDYNRNRDRANGFRVDEKFSYDNGKDSPAPSPEKKSPKKIYQENEKLSQREKLIREIEARHLECLVCCEPIKGQNYVWSCLNCYHIFHLACIIKWASSSKSEDGWRCPACQNVLKDVPRDYYCFCGKMKNPSYNRSDTAHSCGEVCGRIEGCPHACTLLCHPGPCPPCQANVVRECGCGKTMKTMQCYLKETIECDSICGKLLVCEMHKCEMKCHEGKCNACGQKVDQKCHCGKQDRQVACTRDSHDKKVYSCGKPCGRDLSCNNHKCKDCCHAGDCRLCKMSPEVVTSCPCGKMPIAEGTRKACTDVIPVCEGVCGKILRCGKAAHPHHCTNKCHLGNCPPCNKQTAVKCRCGHMDQMIKCRQLSTRADDARCKKRCVKKRSCGKHKCNQECCIDIDHICPMPCNYTLSCGKHKCDQPCHRGNCPPCYRSSFDELYCECGTEVIYPPVACGTKKPPCTRPCSRPHPCDHTPQHNCHSASTCPPCMIFTTKWCFGQHEQRKTIPCSQESFSCGLSCNKPLPCGRHKCIKTCHDGACQLATGEICKQSCTKPRTVCGHKCMAPCHEGDCPDTPCKEMVEVTCECGNRKQMRTCHDFAREYRRIATAQLASSMAEMQRGNFLELSDILGPVKMNNNKALDCNDECRLLERNRRLALGLQIRNPDLPQKLLTKYSDFIRNFAKRDPILVKSIHEALTKLVKLAKESKQKSRSHSFPTMNREKRQLVHEMCEMFGVESVAYDAEPNRNVVATAHKERSWLPATSIMDVIQRESGQRRVPVPSNNAWGLKR